MKEISMDEVEQSDHQSLGQKSGSSQLRSAKSMRKKNIQLEKSTFSAQRKYDQANQVLDNQMYDSVEDRNANQMHVTGFDGGPSLQQMNQYSQPSALQKMIGPLTITERH